MCEWAAHAWAPGRAPAPARPENNQVHRPPWARRDPGGQGAWHVTSARPGLGLSVTASVPSSRGPETGESSEETPPSGAGRSRCPVDDTGHFPSVFSPLVVFPQIKVPRSALIKKSEGRIPDLLALGTGPGGRG